MAYWSTQIRSGQPEKDPSDIKKLILGKSSSGWSTSNLRGTPVPPTIDRSSDKEKKEEKGTSGSFITTPLKGEVQAIKSPGKAYQRQEPTTSVDKVKPAPVPSKPQVDPIESYLNRILALSEMQKLSNPELMWVCQFIDGETRDKQLHLLRELEKMEGSLPNI